MVRGMLAALALLGLLVVACRGGGGAAAPAVGPEVGQKAPPFTLEGLDGGTTTLQDLLREGRPVVLYFFATW